MEFNLLKEFLNSNKTQKDFSKTNNLSGSAISSRLTRQMIRLLNTKVINAKNIILDTSMLIYDVRRNKENWLKAIYAYEQTILAPVNFENDNRKISDLTVSEFSALIRSLNAK